MIRIYLTHSEWRHFEALVTPPSVFRLPNHDTPEGQRAVKVAALESVIGTDYPRDRIGESAFEVYGTRKVETMARWQ